MKKITIQDFKFIYDNTQANQHTEARKQLASVLNNKYLVSKYKNIQTEQHKIGHLSPELSEKRNILDVHLFSLASQHLSNFDELYLLMF